ncbi:MAG: fructose-bisphosphatase class II family protein, partial [Actinomycetota bacterium]|nr:fructose-bisphosphatase class II family protein [Actinomycetota bacterium]
MREAVTISGSATRAEAALIAELEEIAIAATRDAAIACQDWVGRGEKEKADGAATEAMRRVLDAA